MAEHDHTGFPDDPELPELRFLREIGSDLELEAREPDYGADAARLRAEAARRGLLPGQDLLEADLAAVGDELENNPRSEEHTSELQSP